MTPTEVYDALGGFAAALTQRQAQRLERNADVESVEPDRIVAFIEPSASVDPPPPSTQFVTSGIRRIGGLASPTARIDGVDERVDIDVAVLDSGVQRDHPDLNVVGGRNCLGSGDRSDWSDRDGHGTLAAGFIGAIDNSFGAVGVAPGARIWAIRIARPNGYIPMSAALCGLNWVVRHADVIEVANNSWSGSAGDRSAPCGHRRPDRLHEAVCRAVERGVTVVASAGNESEDAGTAPLGAYDEVITVSAIGDSDGRPGGLGVNPPCLPEQQDDHFAFFSNFGSAVDLAAPGVCISSTYIDSQYATSNGTSFSAPLVSGAAALYMAKHPFAVTGAG